MKTLSIVLSFISGLIFLIGYIDYYYLPFKAKKANNPLSWGIWSIVAVASTSSYYNTTDKDFWLSFISIVNLFACFMIFITMCIISKVEKLKAVHYWAIALTIVSALIWWRYKSPAIANLAIQLAILAGFIPYFTSVWGNPYAERDRPWWIWGVAYIFMIPVVPMRWDPDLSVFMKLVYLTYPINCLLLHIAIPIISIIKRKTAMTILGT